VYCWFYLKTGVLSLFKGFFAQAGLLLLRQVIFFGDSAG